MFGLHYKLETKAIALVLAIIGVSSIGGLVEIAPLFTIDQTVEEAPITRANPARVGGPQHLHPRRLQLRHSQMIRTLRDEVERYGPYSRAVSRNTITRCCGAPNAPGPISRVWGITFRCLACGTCSTHAISCRNR